MPNNNGLPVNNEEEISGSGPGLAHSCMAIPYSSVKPRRNDTKVEDLPKPEKMFHELLNNIIVDAQSFGRPDLRERQDCEN